MINRKTFLKSLGIGAMGTLTGTTFAKTTERSEKAIQEPSGAIAKRKLGKNGLMASVLCIGAGSRFTGSNFLPEQEREEYLRYAIGQGVNYIDTATNYGPSEKILGEILTGDDWNGMVLSSKTNSNTYDGIMRDFENSCKDMKRDRLDVFLIHNNALADNIKDNHQSFTTLQKLREQGYINSIGFSTHSAVSLSNAVGLVKEFDLDHLVLNVGEGRVDYRPVVPEILATGCTVAAIKVTRNYEGRGPVESAKLAYKDVLDRSFTSAIISHANAGIGNRGWKKVLDENLKTARVFA